MELPKSVRMKIGELTTKKRQQLEVLLERDKQAVQHCIDVISGGALNYRDKHTYNCGNCGYEANADFNACLNISKFWQAKCLSEQAPIDSAFDCAMPEPKAETDSLVEKPNLGGNLCR